MLLLMRVEVNRFVRVYTLEPEDQPKVSFEHAVLQTTSFK